MIYAVIVYLLGVLVNLLYMTGIDKALNKHGMELTDNLRIPMLKDSFLSWARFFRFRTAYKVTKKCCSQFIPQ